MMKSRNIKRILVESGKQIIMILFSCFMIFPLLWGFLTSLKSEEEIFVYPPKLFSGFTLENYKFAFGSNHLGQHVLITLGLAVCTTILGVLFATFAAYIFSRYSFRGKAFCISFVVCPMLIPGIVNLIPLFNVYSKLGMIDTFWGLVLLYMPSVMPFSIMVLQNYLLSVPFTLEEAAMIDGCSRIQILTKIVFPMMMPGVVAVSMIGFVNIWNEFLTTLIFTTGGKIRTLTLSMYYLIGKNDIHYGAICAIAFVSLLPVLIIFLIFRKQFINSMVDGAIKG